VSNYYVKSKVTDAYNVLSDINRRRMYDEIGFVGLRLVEKPFLDDPSRSATLSFRGTVYVPIFYAAIPSFFLLSILLSLKCDGNLRFIPWGVVWTPMWLIDIGGIILAVKLFFDHGRNEIETVESSEIGRTTFFPDFIATISTILFVLTQVFICLKLDAQISWDWFRVLSPWLAHECIEAMVLAPNSCSPNFSPDFNLACDEESCESEILIEKMLEETKYFQVLLATATERKAFLGHLLRGFLAISLALKLNGQLDWSWFLVYIPIWISLLSQILFSCYFRNWGNRIVESVELVANDAVSCTRIMIKGQELQQLHEVSHAFMKRSCVSIYFAILSVIRLQVRIGLTPTHPLQSLLYVKP
jgi:Transmembrane Fragile-X-F protein